jgi:hypothetical protein
MENQTNTTENKPINNFFCPHSVFEDVKFKEMPLSARYLYTILCKLANRLADNEGWFYRSLSCLEEETHMSRASVSKSKQILKKNQFIDIKRGYYEHSKIRTYDYFRLNGFRFKAKN